ncbi:hypothetical protein ACVBE9_02620 [Eionea flava]
MKLVSFILLMIVTDSVFAGHFNDATISSVVVDANGIARVTLNGAKQVKAPAGCSVNGTKLTYDVNGPAGSAWHSMAIAAQVAQKNVHIIGKNSCLVFNSSLYEEISTFYMLNQ